MQRPDLLYEGGPVISTRTVLFVGVLAVSLPTVIRIVSSPVALLILAPFFIILVAVSCLLISISFAYTLDSRVPPRNNPLSHAARPLAFSTPAAWQAVLIRSQWSHKSPQSLPSLCPDMPVISSTLNEIMIFIVRDFVLSWYKGISSSPSFPTAVSTTLHATLEQFLQRAETIDVPSLFVKRILPRVTSHIEQFRQSEVALRGAALERHLTQSEELDMLLASRYAGKGGRLHTAVDNLSSTFTKQNEEMHLRTIADRILLQTLPEKEAQSKTLRIVAREILACAVLYPIMDMVTDPDFWNRTIEQVAGAAIHQQKLISKVRNVLEAQSPRHHHRVSSTVTPGGDTITIRTDVRQFESFLRSINRCSSLLDARRLKNDVMGEIRRTRLLLANHEKEDWINGERTEDVVAFLDRLYTAKRTVEQRIAVLGGGQDLTSVPETGARPRVSFRDVLSNPTSLSYFMEFMDRRHRSLLVQFWLTVESFKNPLELVDSSPGDEDDPIQDPSSSTTLREDICMINDLYFSATPPHPSLSSISRKYIDNIRNYASNEVTPNIVENKNVRRSVMLAQREVQQEMEGDFEDFQKSELWFRVTEDASLGNRGAVGPSTPMDVQSTSPPEAFHNSGAQSQSRSQLPRSESLPSLVLAPHSSEHHRSGLRGPTLTSPPSTSRSYIDVLMAPLSDTSSETSRAPLFDDPDDGRLIMDESERMEAIQAALTDIIATDQHFQQPRSRDEDEVDRISSSIFGGRKRYGMFGDEEDDGNAEEENEEDDETESTDTTGQGSFQLAGPGDLQLSYEIARLGEKVSKLEAHAAMLDTLIKKAELTGDTQELRLLQKAKSSMTRELRELHFQKTQYEQQESANRLVPHRTRVSIVSSTVGEEEGKSVVRYLVEVQQLAPDGTFASGWVIARRYNEFLRMHNKLREGYSLVRGLDFPGKRLVTSLSGSFVDTRRQALEKYMQNLIAIPVVCESNELRVFLSRDSPFIASEIKDDVTKGHRGFSGRSLVQTMYRSVTESIDDMFFGPSMLDVMIQRLTRQAAEFAGIVGSAVNDEELVAQAIKAFGKATSLDNLMQMPGDLKLLDGETSTSTFSAPICDLVLAIFELHKKNNWLRRQAIVIILQQVFGDTIERKIRQSMKSLFEESRILPLLAMLRDNLWPGGKLKTPSQPRTAEEKHRSRDEANRKLSALVPDLAANMIGRSNARRGARRIFAVLQNRRLNQHIAYTIVDELVAAIFPEQPPT
ncbi:PhoX domain-containing protein [Paxillus ammoniavirescens]|nr:PhoX domain-containing protein [Paxillus ammoniavirescens]